ncbi:peptidase M20 domain-containing protein 2-like [Paramacrobiotus metropolitanus]|uniref:peptidase M20 domain-containing protein 2-like n=1 Tax=Paramacrobiotus metropolitanus TaxID=2943436 RepID=UPI0024458026|nr:peptidase M20 domain-containing protein 2-like [Paramacrobiotus metropolitanus]
MYSALVGKFLEEHKEQFHHIGLELWKNPELLFQEHFAHQLLTDYLERNGFAVQREYAGLTTAFRAEIATANYITGCESHPTVAILCEYDALPQIGHACGHNLIAEVGVAAACAARHVLLHAEWSKSPAKIVVLGCPAEEGGGGKITLINNGAFRDIDFALMIHPHYSDVLYVATLGIERVIVRYTGKASHASCGPWDGINALDAAISAYNSVSLLRQQMKPDWRVHAIISGCSEAVNVIPENSVSEYYIRCLLPEDLPILKEKVTRCFESAALATGCKLSLEWDPMRYLPLRSNHVLADIFGRFAKDEGIVYEPDPGLMGSSDIGNVSNVIPTIQPKVSLGKLALIHTKEFATLAGSPDAQPYALRAAKIIALTTLELFDSPGLRAAAQKEFNMAFKKIPDEPEI